MGNIDESYQHQHPPTQNVAQLKQWISVTQDTLSESDYIVVLKRLVSNIENHTQ